MKKKLLSALLSVAMVSALLTGCGSSATEETAATEPAAEETAEATEEVAEETTEAGDGKVYMLNFKPEID